MKQSSFVYVKYVFICILFRILSTHYEAMKLNFTKGIIGSLRFFLITNEACICNCMFFLKKKSYMTQEWLLCLILLLEKRKERDRFSWYLITLCYQKKSSVLWGIPVDSGSWRPIHVPIFRITSGRDFFDHLKFQLLAISLLFFNLWWFQWIFWNSHCLLILSRRAPEIIFRIFHPCLYPKMRLKKSKNVI